MEAERAAIAELKAGQISGLRILVERYQAQAVQAATFIVKDTSLAEEIVQEAFLRAYQRIDQFDLNRST
ncbi:MAG TPA: sigma factor [Anaerolineaceae bacterium]|jgi:RNA polymerase sigma-70 factor (ECF subfamily)